MSSWRPPAAIKVKAIGLLFQENHLLAAEVLNRVGDLTGVRPLGGSIEFGERREAALRREFREELGAELEILGPWHVFENVFVFEGETGHEIVFAAPVRLRDRILPISEDVVFEESDGSLGRARWFAVDALIAGRPVLYPDGLRDALPSLRPRHKA